MPRSSKGPRLWLEPEERGKDGKLVRHAAQEAKAQKIMAAKTVKPKTENGESDK